MVSLKTVLLSVLVILLIAAVSGGIALLVVQHRSGSSGVQIQLPTITPTPELKVYVSGAVARPGVYSMANGDRLADLIAAAGGADGGARLTCVNLAARISDEDHFHVPGREEPCQAAPSVAGTAQEDSRTDLNTATAAQLESLRGIGPVKAAAIVGYRQSNGPFESTEQIMDVNGIGAKTYEGIRDLASVVGRTP